MPTLHFTSALLPSGWADDVQVVMTDDIITSVTIGTTPGDEDERHQLAIPGIASLHSHAFQRGMAGLAEMRGNAIDTFWTWRQELREPPRSPASGLHYCRVSTRTALLAEPHHMPASAGSSVRSTSLP